jgi:transposase-like protein
MEIILDVEKCKNEPIVDGAPWYKEVLSRRGLKYEVRTRGKRNAVESWFFQIKEENEKLLQKISG